MSGKPNERVERVILFDGVCHLCQGAVKFIIKRDPAGRFRFASLQSQAGSQLLQAVGAHGESLDSVVLIENGTYYIRSAAALRIAKGLRYPWPLLYGLIVVPRGLRDAVYQFVAKHRYRWFGKDETCLVPTRELKERFLEEG
ncbi:MULTISPECIES: thiol-disulfide oxidoreductase DCC family protein [Paenibacillus]|jgi:predicted DCC family thiol-disulfide oxidoreductase YuxK|uniref:thiol-disulfide oxidoreductase DCC family protein n=1 Tax=Paenibacillus TaxID=44249 RepID=UPI000AC9FE10|nr:MULTISPECIES: thiol-disulfide oxidoreductase DCC family protein [Paenibacillus]MDU4694965.1 thiol-disulfide oxidoreductase DCC family protein [Paenibacillus sp.]